RSLLPAFDDFANLDESAALQLLRQLGSNAQFDDGSAGKRLSFFRQLGQRTRLFSAIFSKQEVSFVLVRGSPASSREHNFRSRRGFRQGRQHRAEGFTNRREIVGADPLAEFEKFWRDRGNEVKNARDVPYFRVFRGGFDEFYNDADDRFLAKRHQHAAANLQR